METQVLQASKTNENSTDGMTPMLHPGDHLSRSEFERRYHAHPKLKKAELIEGVVYMPSPARYKQHASPHFALIGWLSIYCAATPGVDGGDNATVQLDLENEPQPDIVLRLDSALGGRSRITDDDYLEGAPELAVEVAASSVSYDMNNKRRAFARNGVQEYLVIQVYEQKVSWFALKNGVYEEITIDANGVLKSEVFPGLWLKVNALWNNDLATMLAVQQEGIASDEHARFIEHLDGLR